MKPTELHFKRGDRVFLPGGSGANGSVAAEILGRPDLRITTSYLPGVNQITSESVGPGSSVTGFFMFPSMANAQRGGTFRHVPLSYASVVRWLEEQAPFDSCLIQVSEPGKNGKASLGPAAEFMPSVLRRARRIIAVVNSNVPFVEDAPGLSLNECAQVIEDDGPLVTYGEGEIDAVSSKVAARVAPFITDGATLQLGLGKVPTALTKLLRNRRSLRLHSGMLSEGVMELAAAGALDSKWEHVTAMFLGSPLLYQWIAGRTGIRLRGCEYTHNAERLSRLERFVSVNSAFSVDLFGQCNLENVAGRASSGCGGAPDFARFGRLSPGGISIVALPANAGPNRGSRIVSSLGAGGITTLSRTEAQVIVTDEGAADLRGLSVMERADALIAVAPPSERSRLADEWREMSSRL